MFKHIVRHASNDFDPSPFTGVESLGFAPPQPSENERFRSAVRQNIFPNPSSKNCTFTVCFKKGK